MKNLWILAFLISFSGGAYGAVVNLECRGQGYDHKVDAFHGIYVSLHKRIQITTSSKEYPFLSKDPLMSTDLGAIDPQFFPVEVSESGKSLYAYVSTYERFSGHLQLVFSKSLNGNPRKVQLTATYDDGDGFGFTP